MRTEFVRARSGGGGDDTVVGATEGVALTLSYAFALVGGVVVSRSDLALASSLGGFASNARRVDGGVTTRGGVVPTFGGSLRGETEEL